MLGVESGGPPYFLFFLCGTTTWILFERSLLFVTRSLERNRKLITKVYFPRLILPMSAVAPGLLYLGILLIVMVGTVIYYFRKEGVWYITLRPELLVSVVAAIVLSLIFTDGRGSVDVGAAGALSRHPLRPSLRDAVLDVLHADHLSGRQRFPRQWRWLVALNPMAPIVELFKWGTLGQAHLTVPAWSRRSC